MQKASFNGNLEHSNTKMIQCRDKESSVVWLGYHLFQNLSLVMDQTLNLLFPLDL